MSADYDNVVLLCAPFLAGQYSHQVIAIGDALLVL